MKKLLLGSLSLVAFSISILIFQFSCRKDGQAQTPPATVCDVRGTYIGSDYSSNGSPFPIIYTLKDNNFAVGGVNPTDEATTWGGYRNTCDSVFLSVYYVTNNSYYLLEAEIRANGDSIVGTYKNLTTPSDVGTFKMGKN